MKLGRGEQWCKRETRRVHYSKSSEGSLMKEEAACQMMFMIEIFMNLPLFTIKECEFSAGLVSVDRVWWSNEEPNLMRVD